MKQQYDAYTKENHEVWQILFGRQQENLQDKASQRYLHHLEEMKSVLFEEKIPDFDHLNRYLMDKTGWSIHVVPGLIPAKTFIELLAERKFCSSTWLRSKKQLDYLEEPDMFHDIFGHIPLLADPDYACFLQEFGQLGVRSTALAPYMEQLEKFYWFTIEFGLIREREGLRIYGAGILSSFLESKSIFTDHQEKKAYSIEQIIQTPFRKDQLQGKYFILENYDQLFDSLGGLEKQIKWSRNAA